MEVRYWSYRAWGRATEAPPPCGSLRYQWVDGPVRPDASAVSSCHPIEFWRAVVFVFGTRLTRITHAIRRRDPDDALSAVGAEVHDWAEARGSEKPSRHSIGPGRDGWLRTAQ